MGKKKKIKSTSTELGCIVQVVKKLFIQLPLTQMTLIMELNWFDLMPAGSIPAAFVSNTDFISNRQYI
jgi:hypothetical protein